MMSSRELSPPDHDNRHHHPHPIRRRDHHHHKYSTYQNYPMNYSDREQCDGYVTPKRKARSLSRPVHPPLNQQVLTVWKRVIMIIQRHCVCKHGRVLLTEQAIAIVTLSMNCVFG